MRDEPPPNQVGVVVRLLPHRQLVLLSDLCFHLLSPQILHRRYKKQAAPTPAVDQGIFLFSSLQGVCLTLID